MIKKKAPVSAAPIKKPVAAPVKKSIGSGKVGASVAPDENEGEDEAEQEEAPKAKAKAGAKADEKAAPNEELVSLFESYDEQIKEAESTFVQLVEYIQDNELDRATVVASMMKARGITFETAQTQYSRMKKLFNNEEVLNELKEGKITLKVAREKTKTAQKNPKAAKPEAKEQRYNTTLKSFVAAAKESGMELKEIIISVQAELKAAGIK